MAIICFMLSMPSNNSWNGKWTGDGTKYSNFTPYPEQWGRGEWEALTLEDAKQMAMDFAESVS